MALLSESSTVLPIHRKILAFSFIGWIFDFYDLLLLSFLISPSITSIVKDLALTPNQVAILLGTPLAFTAVGGLSAARWRIGSDASRCSCSPSWSTASARWPRDWHSASGRC
jgi:hypothetical protein